MFNQSMLGSNHPSDNFSSSKKKASTPALIFVKSQKDSKTLTENNSALINTNRSPMRALNGKNPTLSGKSPLLSKSNIQSSERQQSIIFSKSRKLDQEYQDSSMRDSLNFCQNHENRNANFMSCIDGTNIEYYCEKCAILLASQGYKVEKVSDSGSSIDSKRLQASRSALTSSKLSQKSTRSSRSLLLSNSREIHDSSNARRLQIQNFLSMTKGLLDQIQDKKQDIRENLIKSQQFYGQQIQQVNQYFELVYKSLELEKNKCYNYILNQRIQVERPVRQINDTITELKDKIQGIIDDIEENIQTVYQTTDQIYRPVIQQYEENYDDISKRIADIDIFEVEMRKLDFQGVPESIFCISDVLKDSIEQNFMNQQQQQMSKQLNSLKQSLKDSLPQLQPRKLFSKRGDNVQDSQSKSNNKFCFSFQGQALQAQMQHEKIIYERDE